jgi:O-antigen/teichoic acid export membrane protein
MQVFEQWFIRIKQFGINAKSMFYQSIIIEGSKVGIGLFYPVAPVLIFLTALNNGVRALFLITLGKRLVNNNTPNDLEEGHLPLKDLAKKYKDFPLLRAPQMFIDAISKGLPILLLTSLFSVASAGFFTICNTVLRMPSSLVGSAVGNVFYPKINEAALQGKKLTGLIKKAMFFLGLVGVIPFGLIIAFGPWLFELVFGSNWAIAGEYARWLSLSTFMRFMNEPCIRVLPVLSAQSLHLLVTVIQTITRASVLVIGFFIFKDDQIAIALYGITGAIINVLLILITLNISKKFDYSNLKYNR